MVSWLGDLLSEAGSDLVSGLFEWFFDILPHRVRIGCLTLLGSGVAGLLMWIFLLKK